MTDAALLPTVHSSLLAARREIDNAIAEVESDMGYRAPETQPGAWFAHWNGNYWNITIGKSPYDPSIAAVWSGERNRHSSETTACLVAASPVMLEALRGAMVIIEPIAWPDELGPELRSAFEKRLEAIRAAIAKAENCP